MKCIVCDRDGITDGMSECPDCGFPFIKRAGIGHDAEYQEAITGMAREHAAGYKNGTGIGLTVYSYRRSGQDLELDEAKEKQLIDSIGSNPEGEIYWCDEKFARIETDQPMTLSVVVHGPVRRFVHKVSVEAPSFHDLWQVGVKPEDKLKFRIVVGKKDEYKETEALSMVWEK